MLCKPLQQHLVVAEAPRERANMATVQQALGMAALWLQMLISNPIPPHASTIPAPAAARLTELLLDIRGT